MENTSQKPKKVFVLSGPPGSGKSTLVAQLLTKYGGNHVSRDIIRFALLNDGDDYFSYENEVRRQMFIQINNSIKDNEISYIDATHLTVNSRRSILHCIPKDVETYNIVITFDIPIETALSRNAQRSGRARVPDTVIRNMYQAYQVPSFQENFDEIWHVDENGDIRKEYRYNE